MSPDPHGIAAMRIPLVETHLHLEGSIPGRVLARLAGRAGRRLPSQLPGPGRPFQRGRGFGPFLDAFVACATLLRDEADVEAAASALILDLRRDGIVHAEISFSPQVHLRRGLSFPALMAGLGRARRKAAARGGPSVSYIADGGRLWGAGWFEEMAAQAAEHRRDGIVAVGLGGDEFEMPARAFLRGFERARAGGMRCVAHAGERGGPAEVRDAIDNLPLDRIGHGIGAARDRALLRELARRGIALEICPTSNVMTGAVASLDEHPLRRLLDAGVKVAIGSDDRTIFGTTLRRELKIASGALGCGPAHVRGLMETAVRCSFLPADRKRELLARFPPAAALRPGRRGR